jgi:hypothetical protein
MRGTGTAGLGRGSHGDASLLRESSLPANQAMLRGALVRVVSRRAAAASAVEAADG